MSSIARQLQRGFTERLDGFLASASVEQAALFGAACVERACGILFWVVSKGERTRDWEIYSNALDELWRQSHGSEGGVSPVRSVDIEGLKELTLGDEAVREAAFALHGAIAMHAALKFLETYDVSWVEDCSLTLRNHAFRLGRRVGAELVPGEEEQQALDIAEIRRCTEIDAELANKLRERARGVARSRLQLTVARYG
ncbi:hypothetical protein [Streptomyces jeddahensis]|uniref:DUF416 family protein n=1 Tax=Streptomyces jeddahensis TaxID=1716141 RepID=A0A177HVL0_9ACTN|nr:hypothetical protein [Streptomyces jeddahensis]OAH14148.1 hypothetical protein STSP_25980 [Streptomyces jeddahensis]